VDANAGPANFCGCGHLPVEPEDVAQGESPRRKKPAPLRDTHEIIAKLDDGEKSVKAIGVVLTLH